MPKNVTKSDIAAETKTESRRSQNNHTCIIEVDWKIFNPAMLIAQKEEHHGNRGGF